MGVGSCAIGEIMVEFIIGQAGSGKTTLMLERIKKASEEGKTQYILVPEQYSYEFDKTLYYCLGAEKFNELFSLSFTSLARQLFQQYGDPNRNGEYADDLTRIILIYQALADVRKSPDSLRYFRRQSLNNGFADEVLGVINDLKRAGITPVQLMERSALLEKQLMDKTTDIAAVYLEYDRLMSEYGFKDNLDNVSEAAEIANFHGCFKGKSVYIDEFESFTGDQLKMLRVIISSADNVVIALRTEDVNAGDFTLFETVNMTYRRIAGICRELNIGFKVTACGRSFRFAHPDLEYLSSHIMRNFRYAPEEAPDPENIVIFEARDMYGEAEYVCATVKRLINSGNSLKYRDFAIISNDIMQYADVLKATFERYDIPYFLSVEKPVSHTPIMVFFTSLLDLLSARKIRSELVFRLLKCGILDYSLTDISLLENYCYKWGIEDELWRSEFTAPDGALEKIEAMRSDVIKPIIALKKKLSGSNSASEICTLLYEYLVECNAEKSVGKLMIRLVKENRDHEAAELKRLWGCLIDILDSVNDTLGENELSLREAAQIIRSMMNGITYSVPPQTIDTVIAASARTARLNSPKVVFVMGVTDGSFPNQVSIRGLFSEADKQKLSESGVEISRPLTDLIASERLVVYKALSSASEKLYITYPLSDLSGQAKYPASAIDSIIRMFGNNSIRIIEAEVPPHYYAVTLHSAYYHYMQNKSLNNVSVESVRSVLLESPEYQRRIAYVLSRSDHTQNFRIDREVMQKLKSFYPLELSSTGIEDFSRCRFQYFCRHLLQLQEIDKIELDVRVVGELTHECFRGILSTRTKSEFIGLSYADLQDEINKRAQKYRRERLAGDFGKTAKFDLIFSKLTERLTGVFYHTQQALMASDFIPREYELNLRQKHPVNLPFGGDHELSFGGIVDRLDTCTIGENKYVRIVDYKASRKHITAETLGGGVNLQMLLYLFSATDKGGPYEGYEPAGVLYSPVQISEIALEKSRNNEPNIGAVNSSLKTNGLVLGDKDVLEAMEKNILGNYIPARLTKSGALDARSSCISRESMDHLRDFTYKKLTDMAESLLEGSCEAVPLVSGGSVPCSYCSYVNICDNSLLTRYRTADEESVAEAEEILSQKTDSSKEDE